MCAAVSTTTASLWTMHLLAVALYRADRVLAVWLPTGRYPIFSVRTTNIGLVSKIFYPKMTTMLQFSHTVKALTLEFMRVL